MQIWLSLSACAKEEQEHEGPRKRHECCLSLVFCGCDKDKSNLRDEGSIWLRVPGYGSSWWGIQGRRSLQPLGHIAFTKSRMITDCAQLSLSTVCKPESLLGNEATPVGRSSHFSTNKVTASPAPRAQRPISQVILDSMTLATLSSQVVQVRVGMLPLAGLWISRQYAPWVAELFHFRLWRQPA